MIVMMITNLQEVLRGRSSATKVFAEKNYCYLDLPSSFAIIVLHIICHHYPPFPTIGSHNNCHHHHQSLTCLSYRWWLWHCFQGTCRTGFSELLKHNGFALDADVESLVTLFRSTKAHGRTPLLWSVIFGFLWWSMTIVHLMYPYITPWQTLKWSYLSPNLKGQNLNNVCWGFSVQSNMCFVQRPIFLKSVYKSIKAPSKVLLSNVKRMEISEAGLKILKGGCFGTWTIHHFGSGCSAIYSMLLKIFLANLTII